MIFIVEYQLWESVEYFPSFNHTSIGVYGVSGSPAASIYGDLEEDKFDRFGCLSAATSSELSG